MYMYMNGNTAMKAALPVDAELKKERPVDLVHLSRFTMGERALEREVLSLFRKQSVIYLEKLKSAADLKEWREAAHTLKGSARGIGAWSVADAAETAEQSNFSAKASRKDNVISELTHSVEEANMYIYGLLADH